MTSIAKLKDRARKHEQKEDWKAAIGVYQQVLEAEEGQDELELELSLYNRIGDLYLRLGNVDDAVSYYEQAADKYADSGFLNNAIALCNKALRHRPERPQLYRKLSGLCLEQGFIIDARRWIIDYAEREVKAGHSDVALEALSEFVDASGDLDVREFLAQQLASHDRETEAVQQFARAHAERLQRGENASADRLAEKARAIDPSVDLAAAVAVQEPDETDDWEMGGTGEPDQGAGADTGVASVGLEDDLGDPAAAGEDEEGGLAGLETRPDEGLADDTGAEVAGLEGLEVSPSDPVAEEVEEDATLGGLETFGSVDLDGQLVDEEEPGVDAVPEPGTLIDDEDDPDPLPLVEGTGEEHWDEPAVEDAPEDAGLLEGLEGFDSFEGAGEELEDVEEPEEPEEDAEPLPLLHTSFEDDEAVEAPEVGVEPEPLDEPDAVEQPEVESAEEAGLMELDSLDLGEPAGEGPAVEGPAVEEAGESSSQDVIDLDEILEEMGPEEAAALREAPERDAEDPEFAAMLTEFKARVAERVDTEDAGDHYDLGLAYKEMGLIDEAIAEFQTALTRGEERLKVYEELGQCFMQKEKYGVAVKVLTRALQVPHGDASDLLGVQYQLGQCHEELGNRDAAREAYGRVLEIDPEFRDVPERMARL